MAGAVALNAAPRLLGRWDFEHVANKKLPDVSGNAKHGVIHGAPVVTAGIAGAGLRFQSNDDYVDFGAPIIPARDFTISVWINCDDIEKQFFLGQYRYGHPNRLDLAIRNGSVRIQIDDIIDSPKSITPKRWHHLAYARTGDSLAIYLDGEPIAKGVMPVEVIQTENLILGKIIVPKQDSFRFTGVIDELEIWDGALPGEEIKRRFQNVR